MLPRSSTLALLLVTAAACAEPAGPPEVLVDQPQASLGAATDRGTGTWIIDETVYVECLEEEVAFDAEVTFRYHETVTPGGKLIRLEPFIPNSGTGTAVGQTSGTTWTLARVVSPFVLHASGKGTFIHFAARQHWVSEDAPALDLFSMLHLVLDGEGNVVAEKSVVDRCIPR